MSSFRVVIHSRGRNPHAACFEDLAKAVVSALRILGHEVVPETRPGRLIMFGANNIIEDPSGLLPKDAILFNTEQLAAVDDPRQIFQGHQLFRDHVIWDYSKANLEVLSDLGCNRGVHCPVGFVPSMSTISPEEEDIDVLFYGARNTRRKNILDGLEAAGLKVEAPFGVYGLERDKLIARSKIVLNLHFYPGAVFEIVRVSHLLANRKCVVSEDGGCDPFLEQFAKEATAYVHRDGIISLCKELSADSVKRRQQADRGYHRLAQLDFVESVRNALAAS